LICQSKFLFGREAFAYFKDLHSQLVAFLINIQIFSRIQSHHRLLTSILRHPADVLATWADISKAKKLLKWRPQTPFKDGVARLVDWYNENREWASQIATE